MSQSYLISGVDLLSVPCITPADVQQAITQAQPQSTASYHIGFVIVSDSAPDVVSNPETANFIWLKSNLLIPTGEFYYYTGSTWTLLSLVSGAMLANGSVPLAKLSLTGAAPYYIIQVNATGDALQYVSIITAIQNGTVPVNKIVSGGSAHVFVSLAGVNQFVTIASLVNQFAEKSIIIDKLTPGPASAHGLFLRTFEDGTIVEWADFDPNEQIDNEELEIQKLSGASLTLGAGQAFRRNLANNGWEPYSPLLTNFLLESYDTNAVIGATQDIILVKPSGKIWRTFEIDYVGNFSDGGSGGNCNVQFSWQTAPVVGLAIVPGSGGTGNGGQIFSCANSDDTISPTWMYKGTIPSQLSPVDVITLRATVTILGLSQTSGVFMGKGVHDA